VKLALQSSKILVASRSVDFRKSLDGLCALIIEELKDDPADGIYVFYNAARNRVKIIGYHRNGFVMFYKRLDSGKFFVERNVDKIRINKQQLDWLLLGVNWRLFSEKNVKFNAYF
jgi:transposase